MAADVTRTAQAHLAAGRLEAARSLLVQALARTPAAVEAIDLLAGTLMQMGQFAQARYYAERVCALRPGNPDALCNLGKVLLMLGDNPAAVACLQKAVAAQPEDPSTLAGLTNALNVSLRFAEAERLARQGLERWPQSAELLVDLGWSLQASGRSREAVRVFRQASTLHPDDAAVATLYALSTNYAGDVDPPDGFEAHRSYGRMVERAFPGPYEPARTEPDPDRRLRVGFISADLRAHATRFFVEPLLEHVDRSRFDITCFSTSAVEDAVSNRIKSMVGAWRAVAPLSIPQLAEAVRGERIDILIELSGHTIGHRLQVFQLRPAPVTISYLGYPNTTGMRTVDYRIVDSITDPPGPSFDALATERLWRLDPCFLCYKPPTEAPAPAPPPSTSGAPFTFGSFNNLAKHDELALDLYRRVLEAVPGSRMLLRYGGLAGPGVRELVLERFASAGIPADRLVLDPPGKSAAETLPAYARMDVMLDSFPYHGTTTTCEALSMGVPVVTMMGHAHVARVSGSILSGVGLSELVASTPEQYVAIAAALAADPPRLASIRSTLRPRMLASPVCDGPGFARRLEGALRLMWRVWCGTQARP